MKREVDRNEYHKFGYELFGPFLYGFTLWLKKQLQSNSFDKVFFFSRDGYMMKKAFDSINDTSNIDSRYIYFSRRSISKTLLYRCSTYDDSLRYLTWHRFYSLSEWLAYYGFGKKDRVEIADTYELNLSKEYTFSELKSSIELRELYECLKVRIDENSKKQEMVLCQYLQQNGVSGRCAIVDIGWHGSMQSSLEQLIELHNWDVEFSGFYVGISPLKQLKGKVYGYLYEPDNLKMRKSLLCFFGGYEKFFQSCEGSTFAYEATNDGIVPILTEYEYEDQVFIDCIQSLQEGALEFVINEYRQNKSYNSLQKLAIPLVRFGKNPPLWGVRLFSFFYNTDGEKNYFVSQKSLVKYSLKEMVCTLSDSPWKTGFLKSLFKIPLPYYWIYSVLRK